jgi:Fe-S-cluster containining protein
MRSLFKDDQFNGEDEKSGAGMPWTEEEKFIRRIHTSVDHAIACGLERLRSEQGLTVYCRLGCSHCCRFHIPVSIAEAYTLSRFIKREFTVDQTRSLRMRTLQWHEWDGSRPGRHPSARIEVRTDLTGYDHCCPLLVDGACSIYPVRPVVCRTHFVTSHPWYCYAANDPESSEKEPLTLDSLLTAAGPFVKAIERHIEESGSDFSRSVMLLPHWLAIQMDWDFALTG